MHQSKINQIDFSNIKETNLSDDLEIATNLANTSKQPNKIDYNNNDVINLGEKDQCLLVNDDEDDKFLFKIPHPVPLSENLKLSKQNKINNSFNLELDSTQFIGSLEQYQNNLNRLFGVDDFDKNDENDKDFLIRTQPIFSSTQSVSMQPSKTNNIQNESLKITEKSIESNSEYNNNFDNSVIITTQSVSDLINKKNSDQILFNPNSTFIIDQDLCDKSIWEYAQNDLNIEFNNAGLDPTLLKKFTIDYYFKKNFDYNLLKINDNSLRKIPIMCVYIKEINRNDRNSNATVVLTDGVNEIKGTILKQITSNYWDQMGKNSVLLLQNVCLMRVNFVKNGYHLIIRKQNLVCIYYKIKEKINKISKLNLNELISSDINSYIENFQNNYIYFAASLIKSNNGRCSSNKSSLIASTSSNNSSSNNKYTMNNNINAINKNYAYRIAPYQLPPNLNRSNNNKDNNKMTISSFNQTNLTSSSNDENKNFISGSLPYNIILNNNNNNNKPDASLETFQFKANSNSGCVQSSMKKISEEDFSQLIFGIEEEFLKDDE